ncbi:MAG TPA: MBL fold metallo-hydrolase [Acidimicrobiia bacterium]
MIEVLSFRTEGLGDSSYLVKYDGRAVLVDPQRDFERFLDHLAGAELRWVLETHLHNDYVSGGLSAARVTGAELVLPASAAPAFRHTPAFHGEDLVDGPLAIRPLHTPGHTPEHTSYLLVVEGRPEAVFSGGSLLVGSAGRSDLLGMQRAESLARLQYRSLRRLASLPAETGLYPTHGAGSFCTASAAGGHTSTIGAEVGSNPALAHPDEDSFVAAHLEDLQPYPRYYARMGGINLAGPPPMPSLVAKRLEPDAIDPSTPVIDARSADDYASGHFPGSLNIPMSHQFGTWFGWLVPLDEPAVLVVSDADQAREALLQLARIGIDEILGVIVGEAGPVASRTSRVWEVPEGAQILDVRSPGEHAVFSAPETFHAYVPDLLDGPPSEIDQAEPVYVACASGYRSAIAASLLRRHGIDAIPVLEASVTDLLNRRHDSAV